MESKIIIETAIFHPWTIAEERDTEKHSLQHAKCASLKAGQRTLANTLGEMLAPLRIRTGDTRKEKNKT